MGDIGTAMAVAMSGADGVAGGDLGSKYVALLSLAGIVLSRQLMTTDKAQSRDESLSGGGTLLPVLLITSFGLIPFSSLLAVANVSSGGGE